MVDVSLATEQSIEQEYARPLEPADAPYVRKDFKKYKMSAEGVMYNIHQFEPYQIDRDTLSLLLRNVWRKLRQDAQLVNEMRDLEMARA